MAVTGATVAVVQELGPDGPNVAKIVTVTMDNSYATGGESVTAANLGLSRVVQFSLEPNAGYVPEYDHANSKVKAYWTGAATSAVLAEVTAATDLSAVVFRGKVVGLP